MKMRIHLDSENDGLNHVSKEDFQRQAAQKRVTDTMVSLQSALVYFPVYLLKCLETRVWEHERNRLKGPSFEPMTFNRFVRAKVPVGLGTTLEALEVLIADGAAMVGVAPRGWENPYPRLLIEWEKVTGRKIVIDPAQQQRVQLIAKRAVKG